MLGGSSHLSTTTSDWKVDVEARGPSGSIYYKEQSAVIEFYWEFGGGDVVMIIWIPDSSAWDSQYPWAAGRRLEIIDRMTQEVIRQKLPTCRVDKGDQSTTICLREKS
jgi:hypothetical protein